MSYRTYAPLALVMGGLWACQESVTTVEVSNPPVVTEPSVVPQTYAPPTCPEHVPDLFGAVARQKGRLVVVFKHDYLLGLYVNGQLAHLSQEEGALPACFPVAMGDNPYTAKTVEDRASSPEGWYRVGGKVPLGVSRYHQALAVSYPNGEDAERAFAAGIINAATRDQIKRADKAKKMPPQFTAMGGEIMIHGNGAYPRDWTWGCLALDNHHIDWLYSRVKVGDQILILPWSVSLEGGEP